MWNTENFGIKDLVSDLIADKYKNELYIETLNVSFEDIIWEDLENWTFEWFAQIKIEFEIFIWTISKVFEIEWEWSYINEDNYDTSFIDDEFNTIENDIKEWFILNNYNKI
jgi:hypothetical protein